MSKRADDDHDRDALLSALAAWRWRTGEWTLDLHQDEEVPTSSPVAKLLHPAGPTVYACPRPSQLPPVAESSRSSNEA